jgi:predicted alpha/beta hydrolase family esterase
MKKHILFLQGGAGEDDHTADAKLVDSLQEALGDGYELHYPLLPEESSPDFGRMKQIAAALAAIPGKVIVVAHSLGASMLLKYLSETDANNSIAGIFLIAAPFWEGEEDWKQGLKLSKDFAGRLPADMPIYLYHAKDDEEVPFEHLGHYAKQMPQATVYEMPNGGHQLNDDLSMVAKDIKAFRL